MDLLNKYFLKKDKYKSNFKVTIKHIEFFEDIFKENGIDIENTTEKFAVNY
jgi:hypothetical protein